MKKNIYLFILVFILGLPPLSYGDCNCAEDINGDGIVDTVDFLLFIGKFGQTCSGCREDINQDGIVNTNDFLLLVGKFNAVCSPPLTADPGSNATICSGSHIVLGGNPAGSGGVAPYRYSWTPSAGLNSDTIANPDASPASTTTYTLAITDSVGCTSSSTVTATVNPTPAASAGADKTICFGSCTPIGGSPTAFGGTLPYTFSWSPPLGLCSATLANPTAAPSGTTGYTVVVTDGKGCSSLATVTVKVNPLPVVGLSASPSFTICSGSSLTISGTGAATYTWSTGDTATSINVFPTTTSSYTVTGTDTNGCANSAPASVQVNPLPPAVITPGGSTTFYHLDSVLLTANSGAGLLYSWSTGSTHQSVTIYATGNYVVKVTDLNGCSAVSPGVFVHVLPRPYTITSSLNSCVSSTFCLPVAGVDTVKKVIGYDVTVHYDRTKVHPTGFVHIGNDLINPSYADYALNNVDSISTIYVSLFLRSSAPANASFNGTGNLLCIEFTKTAGFNPVDSARFSVPGLQESYYTGVASKLVEPGKYSTYKDSIFSSSLQFWANDKPIKYDSLNPSQFLVTNIFGNDAGCTNKSAIAVQPDLSGRFRYNILRGPDISIEKDIPDTIDVQPVINGADALLARKVLLDDPSFVPSIYQIIAMDVNMDGVVSAGDVSQINRRTILMIPEFKQAWNYNNAGVSNGEPSKDWLFIDSSRVSTDPAYHRSATYPLSDGTGYSKARVPVVPFCLPVPVTNFATCPLFGSETYTGILLGDADGNYTPDSANTLFRQNADEKIVFNLPEAVFGAGYADIPVYALSSDAISAFDFAVKFNETKLSFQSVRDNLTYGEGLAHYNSHDRTLRFTSYSLQSYDEGQPIVWVRFSLKSSSFGVEDLHLLKGYLNGRRVKIEIASALAIAAPSVKQVRIYPNPASEVLYIDAPENATIQLIEPDGRVIYQAQVSANRKLEIDTKNLAGGIYLVKIYSANLVSTEKVAISR